MNALLAQYGISLEAAVFIMVLGGFALVAPIIMTIINSSHLHRRAKKLEQRRNHKHIPQAKEEASANLRKQEGDTSLPLLTAILTRLPRIKFLRARLSRAGLSITAERFLVYNGLLFTGVMLIASLVFSLPPNIALPVAIIIGIGLPHVIVNFRIGSNLKSFLKLFPDAIDLIVRGLRAGLPVTESIKMVAKEIEDPVGSIFQAITDKMTLGIPMERALSEMANKYQITEFDFFVTSIILQRETGGNLSEILSNLSEALRQRLMMRLKIKAMSSEARASMYIISALPFFVIGALAFISPDYLRPLLDDPSGHTAIGLAVGMMSSGIFIMMRMTKFEI